MSAIFRSWLYFVVFVFSTLTAVSQLQPYQPTHAEILERYKAASQRDSAVRNTIYKANVEAHWQAGGNAFWYRNLLKDSLPEYLWVDAATGKKQTWFNPQVLAEALGKSTGKPVNVRRLALTNLNADKNGSGIGFGFKGKYYTYQPTTNILQAVDSLYAAGIVSVPFEDQPSRWENFRTDSLAPNKQYSAFIKDNNVFIRPLSGGEPVQYTKDGTNAHPYGSLAWSPDSKYVVGYHITPVQDTQVSYVLTSVPGTTRGQLRQHPYKQPGDAFTTYEMFLFPVQGTAPVKVATDILDFFDAPRLYWASDNKHFLYEKADRGHQRFRIVEVELATGKTRNIVDEQTKTFIYENRIFTHYLPKTEEIIWSSEKDGWQHLYLVDSKKGSVKNEITKGNYVVRSIDSVDAAKREIWFSASGRNAGEDPYYEHFYRISFDGKQLVDLTPERGHHYVSFSPDRRYFTDRYSEVNKAPVTELRLSATGAKVTELERADISAYMAVVKRLLQPFVAKGRDGVTDIWGVVCLPTEFDSTKKYPIIENIYAGPQDAFVPKSFMGYNREMQSTADLGFIVVQIDGMGTANRSKAFHDVCWHNLADAGFPDRILWMKALAAKYPYADTSRVGLYGTSAGGQNALGGLLFHPEWYKAAVSACGCHDNRVDKQWWNEQWMGYPVGNWYEQQSNVTNAAKLKGNLLLIVGEADTNVPPESTYRVMDALIKAGKTCEFLPIPGLGHSDGGPYGRLKKRDFFVQHLLGAMPPQRNSGEL